MKPIIFETSPSLSPSSRCYHHHGRPRRPQQPTTTKITVISFYFQLWLLARIFLVFFFFSFFEIFLQFISLLYFYYPLQVSVLVVKFIYRKLNKIDDIYKYVNVVVASLTLFTFFLCKMFFLSFARSHYATVIHSGFFNGRSRRCGPIHG